jgi:RND family efflux transporter MFP subunit
MNASKPTLDELRIARRPERELKSRWLAGLAVLGLLLATGLGFWSRVHATQIEVRAAPARAISSGGAERTVLNASGYVTARREATVSAKVTGKIVQVLIEEGVKVKAGQVLAQLDDSNLKTSLDVTTAQLDSARLAVEETRAQLKQADLEFDRTTELAKQKIASQSDLEKAESDAMTLRARLARQVRDITTAEREVDMVRQQIEDMTIRAPFDGVVTTKDAQPGEMISPVSAGGGFTRTGICTIVDMNSIEIEIDVNENYINRVEPGQGAEATLDAYPEWKIPCKVIAIIPTADRQKATVKVRIGFDKLDPRILPEMSVKVAFRDSGAAAAATTRLVLVPKSAVQNLDGRDIVWIVNNSRAERRAVTVSDTQNDDAVLSAGVSAGEKVIAEPAAGLKDGAMVKEKKP